MSELWPEDFDPDHGFSDQQLSFICGEKFGRSEGSGFFQSPWLFWSSEMYSHGRCLREWLGWPSWLPLPAFSDHGIEHFSELHGPELSNEARIHLTWSEWRQNPPNRGRRRILWVQHPWVTWRRRNGIEIREDANGILLFLAHTLPGHDWPSYDWDHYFNLLRKEGLWPKAIIVAMHDVRENRYQQLRKYGIPIISAGNTDSPRFIERFYDLASRFRFATSSDIGSSTYFCFEMGIDFRLHGNPRPAPKSFVDEMPSESFLAAARKSFSHKFGENFDAKREVVVQGLGLNRGDGTILKLLRTELALELLMVPCFALSRIATKFSG